MRIFYIIQYFPPELNGGATRASELARLWAQAGHDVTILTGFPNHPNGRIPEAYRGKFFLEESIDGYRVRRTFVYATPNKGFFRRLLNHTSLMVSTILGSLFKERPDVIIASSPPLFLGISGLALSRLKSVPYFFEARDIWPQQAIDLGMLRNKRIIRAMESLEFYFYHTAKKVIGVAESSRSILTKRGVDPGKIEIIFNGTDTEHFKPCQPNAKLRECYGLQGKFVVSYVGTMGLSQGLTIVLEAAQRLQQINPQVHFLMVGDGAQRDTLMQMSQEMQLSNVTFVEPQPRSIVPELYTISDATLVLLRDLPLFHSTIPSKMFEIMACGVPLILGVRGEAEGIVRRSSAGLYVEPENVSDLVTAIQTLFDNPNERDRLAANGPLFVRENFDRQQLADRYLDIMQAVLE